MFFHEFLPSNHQEILSKPTKPSSLYLDKDCYYEQGHAKDAGLTTR